MDQFITTCNLFRWKCLITHWIKAQNRSQCLFFFTVDCSIVPYFFIICQRGKWRELYKHTWFAHWTRNEFGIWIRILKNAIDNKYVIMWSQAESTVHYRIVDENSDSNFRQAGRLTIVIVILNNRQGRQKLAKYLCSFLSSFRWRWFVGLK